VTRNREPRSATTFTEFVHARRHRRDPSRLSDDKLWGRAAAEDCGIPLPELYGVFDAPAEIDFDALPDRFALKPTKLTNRRGVLLLERDPQGVFTDHTGAVMDAAGIRAGLEELLAAYAKRGSKLMAEELIPAPPGGKVPLDYKFFMIGAEPVLIESIDRDRAVPRIRFYDADFDVLDRKGRIVINFRKAREGPPRPPDGVDPMLQAARTLARHLATPFVRIDMFARPEGGGPVLGEITSTPGGAYFGTDYRFTEDYDRELGAMWTRAAEELGVPVPLIVGDAPIRWRARKTVRIKALALRDLKSDLRETQIRNLELEKRLRRTERRLERAERSVESRLRAFARRIRPRRPRS